MDKLPSDTTLWLMLRKFESTEGKNLNFTARGATSIENGASGAGRIFYEMPILNTLGRELNTFGDLQKTLAQLGVNSGSIMIRLNFKKTEQPLEEAMAEIGQYFKEEAPVATTEVAPSQEVEGITQAIAKLPSTPPPEQEEKGSDTVMAEPQTQTEALEGPLPITPSKRPAPSDDVVLGPDGRPVQVYAAPSSHVPQAALADHNEQDYEPTIMHAKFAQARLQKSAQNQRLESDSEIARQEQEKAAQLAKSEVVIRVKFDDQTSIEKTCGSEYTAAGLYEYVKGCIIAEDQPFKLIFMRAPIPKDEKKRLIKDLDFRGKVLVHFVWEDGASEKARVDPTLKEQYRKYAKEVSVPGVAMDNVKEEQGSTSIDKGKGKAKEGGSGEPDKLAKLNKIFGFGKKK